MILRLHLEGQSWVAVKYKFYFSQKGCESQSVFQNFVSDNI